MYQWYQNQALIPGETNQKMTVTVTANYSVVVTDANGCEGEDSIHVVIVSVDPGISAGANEGFELYPNPTKGDVFLRSLTPIMSEVTIRLIDLQGQILAVRTLDRFTEDQRIELDNFSKGIYFVEVLHGDIKKTFKVIHE